MANGLTDKGLMKKKSKMGRPSSYKPEYCQKIIELMGQGYSVEAFAGSVGVSKDTVYEWCDVHPDFSDAKKIGQAKSQLHWETQGQTGLWDVTTYGDNGKPVYSKKLNSAVWIFNMKNRFNWRDKHEVDAKIDATIAEKDQKIIEELKQLFKAMDGKAAAKV